MSQEEIQIIEAQPSHAKAFLQYLRQVGSESDNMTFGKEGLPVSVEQEEKILKNYIDSDTSVCYLAMKDNEIVGNIALNGMPRRMHHRASIAISVLKNEWNHGIAKRLLEATIDYAKTHGIEIINLEVRVDNSAAIHLYEKYGFRKIGISPAFLRVNGEDIDCLSMYLDLR